MDAPLPPQEPAPERPRPAPRYIAILVAAAGLVLVAGGLLRPGKQPPTSVVQTTELATLPERSQRRVLRDLAGYIGERTGTLGASVVHVDAWSSSGLVIGPDSILTVGPTAGPDGVADQNSGTPHVRLVTRDAADSTALPAALVQVDSVSPRWTLLVARAGDGRPLSLAGLIGGVGRAQCGELAVRELLFDAPVPKAFVGGAMFDLDGNALAMAIPCAGRIALVPVTDLLGALQLQTRPEQIVWIRFGFRAAPPDSLTRALLGVDSGWVVTELVAGSPADAAGLRAGDVLAGGLSLTELAAVPEDAELRIRGHNGARALEAPRDTRPVGEIDIVRGPVRPPPGLSIRRLSAGSRAARAGLRPDDRILQIGRDRRPTPAAVQRALADSAPVLLVYERSGHRRVLVLE